MKPFDFLYIEHQKDNRLFGRKKKKNIVLCPNYSFVAFFLFHNCACHTEIAVSRNYKVSFVCSRHIGVLLSGTNMAAVNLKPKTLNKVNFTI